MSMLRELLRSVPSITGVAPAFDPSEVPAEPTGLFVEWLREAISGHVPEAHAATLSTVDADGLPDARVLVLKDVTAAGEYEFATGAASAKGVQLSSNPSCALSFHWIPRARAVRIRGVAIRGTSEEAARDFKARSLPAKAAALLGRQSTVVGQGENRKRELDRALAQLREDPEVVPAQWSVWRVVPSSVEFWQGSPDREHVRVRYVRDGGAWQIERLWS